MKRKSVFLKRFIVFCVCLVLVFSVGLCVGFSAKKEKLQFVEVEKVKYEVVYLRDEEPNKNKENEYQSEKAEVVEMVATAYCSCEKCCDEWANKRPLDEDGNPIVYTASGTVAKQGRTVAADPSVYPYGTVLLIDGTKYVVEDCGGAIKGNRVDVYFESHSEALKFGKKTVFARVERVG